MDELSPARLFLMRSLFVAITLLIIFFHLLPIDTQPVTLFAPELLPPLASIDPAEARLRALLDQGTRRMLIGPDLLIAFAFAWSLRRPEYVPTLLLAVIFLLSDLLLQRPPGLWALLALLACENLKGRSRTLRDSTFGAEWIAVSLLLTGILIANRVVLSVLMVTPPHLRLSLLELGITILVYPVVVFVTRSVMGVRRAAPGELDTLGRRT
ncbi:rod shape-determining protein MreD [Sulfitobacter sp. F26169L]|uniref:rod shape-determining protein MreD n=1 Tax=Sulfitobacter sp. F26169L TaxID=2996015 RepID=UPI002260F868|nr:rod shape-determining protein MreD [Sulfitobacter sp. F26169L]MCX7567807.1 rod shape-determining protein MreD [Sulfitobacter sp. F26169L]